MYLERWQKNLRDACTTLQWHKSMEKCGLLLSKNNELSNGLPNEVLLKSFTQMAQNHIPFGAYEWYADRGFFEVLI